MRLSLLSLAWLISSGIAFAGTTEIAGHVDRFLVSYCLDCHDADSEKGEINLDFATINWSDPHAATVWGKAYEMIKDSEMPPEDKKQPSPEERATVAAWLKGVLLKNDKPGGTVLRRLSRVEYEHSVIDALNIPFKIPHSFPSDREHHGFDNIGEGLVLSPPLMAQYLEIATAAADMVLPPAVKQKQIEKEAQVIGPDDFTLNFTTGHLIDGVLRMVLSSDPLARGSIWPNRFEAKATGVYQVEIDLSAFKPIENHSPVVHLLCHEAAGNNYAKANELKLLAEFEVTNETPKSFKADVELQKGQTIVVHYENAALSSDQDAERKWLPRLTDQLVEMFREDPELGAAWMKAGYQRSDRGWSWYERIEKIREAGDLDVENFDPDSKEVRDFAFRMARQSVNTVETMSCYLFSKGPGVNVHQMKVTGPMPANRKIVNLKGSDFTSVDYTGTLTDEGRYRLISSRETVAGSMVWPARFEAKVSGVYRVALDATTFEDSRGLFKNRSDICLVELWARKSDGRLYQPMETMRKLGEFRLAIGKDAAQNYTTEVELEKGDTVAIRWSNGPLYSEKGSALYSPKSLAVLTKNKRIHAAHQKLGASIDLTPLGYYRAIMKEVDSGELNMDDPALLKPADVTRGAVHNRFARIALNDTILHGPAVDLIAARIDGPLRLVEDNEMREQRLRTRRFLDDREGRNDPEYAEAILRPFLGKVFRRPATDAQLQKYLDIALRHQKAGHRFEDGLHLALRAALCSPNFLYRGQRPGKLDDYDLAARLSYFLTSFPPDDALRKLASSGKLSEPKALEAQTRRLLKNSRVKFFLDSFTGQWLDLRLLPDIMPDTRLLTWRDQDLKAITEETEMFVAEILRKNHPLETFIDPDFTYLNKRNAKLYGIKHPNSDKMVRVDIEPGGRRGGILTQASVMMATANGVDTQPVLRGVWLLENILGDPVPGPPSSVPAVEPDTSGATSIRELLDRHKADASCASCHKKIDPPGFALENFDPVGRWRDHYPVYQKVGEKVVRKDGLPIDAEGTLTDGTGLRDVTDLKRYLVENIDIFGNCLAAKLLVYATGRDLGFGDRREVEQIVKQVRSSGNGFQDLIVALVLSESFQTK